ncbi:MAG: hypothetical protein JXA82_10935 [Sedimentisphaerales bacterium]|nr:hypothetical protein [Sedimentisphaerales bacterium]
MTSLDKSKIVASDPRIRYIALVLMDTDQILGCILVAASLTAIVTLTLWARRTIHRIAANGYRTARQTLKGFNSDK